MIKPGTVSVTFRKKTVREVIDIVKKAGLYAIEWGSDVHVPQGDIALASEVKKMTLDAGIEIPSYGSYYHVTSKDDFAPFLNSAKALGAKNIRVWAGGTPSAEMSFEDRKYAIENTRKISDMAASEGISISTEYHGNSLTDSVEAAQSYLNEVNHPNFHTYWQQVLALSHDKNLADLKTIYATGKLTNLHVYQYHVDENGRRQIPITAEEWLPFFKAVDDDTVRYAYIEFVAGYPDEEFIRDAKVLLSI